ncbi:MAG: sigma-70 family RNA polymerase sigma factor [Acidimicrobiia bacterium]|nr:sigma-70 family RNA polymerase sigma factor [Acidimicrobiia bacterium]
MATGNEELSAPGEAAYRALYEAHYRDVLAYCRRRASSADAQDAAAEVFTIAWRRRDEMPAGDQARPWLFGVAYRVLSHQWRGTARRSRLAARLSSFRPMPGEGPDAQVVQHRDYELVRSAAARLAPLDQEVLRLVMWEEMSHEQVAAMIGSTVPAAKQRFHRAKGRLAREFKKLGGTVKPIAQGEGGT